MHKCLVFVLFSFALVAGPVLADGLDNDPAAAAAMERSMRNSGNNTGNPTASPSPGNSGSGNAGNNNAGSNSTDNQPLNEKAKEIRDRARKSMEERSRASKLKCEAKNINYTSPEGRYPGEAAIHHTNNLRRPTGIALSAVGDRIYFTGTVVDTNCVPVQDALVEIWQADNAGQYAPRSKDQNFLGSGRTETDNEGNFSFVTIFPGPSGIRAPQIKFRITHPDFPELMGEVFFERHPMNAKDPYHQMVSRVVEPYTAQAVTLGEDEIYTDRKYHVKIVLKGLSTFKRF